MDIVTFDVDWTRTDVKDGAGQLTALLLIANQVLDLVERIMTLLKDAGATDAQLAALETR